MRAFKFSSSSLIEANFKLLREKEKRKHGAENDFSKLPKQRQLQIDMINCLIDQLKKTFDEEKQKIISTIDKLKKDLEKIQSIVSENGVLTDQLKNEVEKNQALISNHESQKKELDEKHGVILTGGIWYLRIWIKKEGYSGLKGLVSTPTNSILYNGIPSIIGVSPTNQFDNVSRNEALIAFVNYLHKNNNFLKEIEKNFNRKENESSVIDKFFDRKENEAIKIEKISATVKYTVNRKLTDANLQAIKEKLLGKHQKTKYLYWQDEIKYNRNILLKHHVNTVEKPRKLVMKDYANPIPFMSKENKRKYVIYQNFQENMDIPRIRQDLSFIKPKYNWVKKPVQQSNLSSVLTINAEFKTLMEMNFFNPPKPSFIKTHQRDFEKKFHDEIKENVRIFNIYRMFKASNEELKKMNQQNKFAIKPSDLKVKPIVEEKDVDPENIITHSRKNNLRVPRRK